MSKELNATIINEKEYVAILEQAVAEIRSARNTIARLVNNSTNTVYWNLGKLLFEKQLAEGYGSGVV